jgi:signal transduction histidine kinase
VELFALHAGIAIQNARMHADIQRLAIVDERLRISHDLHDGIIQSIYAVSLSLEDVADLIATEPGAAADRVDRAIDRLHTTISDIRSMIVGLGPEAEAGLGGAIEAMAVELFAGSGIRMALDLTAADELTARLQPEAAHALVQIAREALSNVARHSGAGRASLEFDLGADGATMRIEDDGVGFDPAKRYPSGQFGLANLRDRAAGLGGTIAIESEPGRGTRIIVRLPIAPSESPT